MVQASVAKAKLHGLSEDKVNVDGEVTMKVTREFVRRDVSDS
jgi:hypothetical protein